MEEFHVPTCLLRYWKVRQCYSKLLVLVKISFHCHDVCIESKRILLMNVEIIFCLRQKYIINNLRAHAILNLKYFNFKCLIAVGSCYVISKWMRCSCAICTQCCLAFVNLMRVDLVGAELFQYFTQILLNFWITREWFIVVLHSKNKITCDSENLHF